MASDDPAADSDEFGLHYVLRPRRCLVYYDTLEEALEGASKKLQKNRELEIWITDRSKRMLLDGAEIRARLSSGDPSP